MSEEIEHELRERERQRQRETERERLRNTKREKKGKSERFDNWTHVKCSLHGRLADIPHWHGDHEKSQLGLSI